MNKPKQTGIISMTVSRLNADGTQTLEYTSKEGDTEEEILANVNRLLPVCHTQADIDKLRKYFEEDRSN
jgi:hypothetical protein